ncbi:MAG: methyltransferase domain-containing protein, partial [Pseudomonadota bacterium]
IGGRAVACLELAAGRAANSAWLARRHAQSRFTALDLSEVQLRYARRSAARLANLAVRQGDYHDLSGIDDASTDIVFNIEGLCYSTDKARVFAEVFRVLKPGGSFLIYDGYSDRPAQKRAADESRAALLLERGMAITEFERYPEMIVSAQTVGFDLADQEDLSAAIMPSAERLERRATRLLDLGPLAHVVIRALPVSLIDNVVTAYLMPILIRRRVFCYMATVLRKPPRAGEA